MVKGKFTKMVMVTFVDGEIKGAHDVTWCDIKSELAKSSDIELEALCDAIDAEYDRRLGRVREKEEEIAVDAMYDQY